MPVGKTPSPRGISRIRPPMPIRPIASAALSVNHMAPSGPAVVMRPIAFTAGRVNHTAPSDPAAIPSGAALPVRVCHSVYSPPIVIRPIELIPRWLNQMAPSAPTAIPVGNDRSRTGNSESSPPGVRRPMRLPLFSVNHMAPSGPCAIENGSTPDSRLKDESTPSPDIRTIWEAARFATHVAPSGPAAMPWGKESAAGRSNHVGSIANAGVLPVASSEAATRDAITTIPAGFLRRTTSQLSARRGPDAYRAKVGSGILRPGEGERMLRRMASAEPLVVLAGRLLDPVAGEVLTDRAVVIRDDRVEAVIPAAQAPSGERLVDLSDGTVLPGLIDCHAHLIGELDRGHGYGHLVRRTSAQEALTGVANAGDTLRAGFTTVRDVGTFHAFVDVALREAIEGGTIPGP